MTPSDDLGALWQSVPVGGKTDPRELLAQLDSRARRFDRTIRNRNWRESLGGVLVAVIFLWMGLHASTLLDRAGNFWLSGCGMWVAAFLWRYSNVSARPSPDQPLSAYRSALLDRYDRQIRLLQGAKYWYVLPFWAGLMVNAIAFLRTTGSVRGFLILVVIVTALNGAIWWANDVAGVRWLRGQRRQLLDMLGDQGEAQ